MSFKTGLVKFAIECTPNIIVIWVANIVLKGIAKLSDVSFDLDARTAYAQATLYGETEPIEVWLDGFAIASDESGKYFILRQGNSNKPWLHNLLSRIAGKAWKIPSIPQFSSHIELLAELLKTDDREQEANETER